MRRLLGLIAIAVGAALTLRGHAVAGDEGRGKTSGRVISTAEGTLKLKAGSETLAFSVPKGKPLPTLEVSQLNPGEDVTVTWVGDGARKLIQDIEGRGTVVGTITHLGEAWIEVTPLNGKPQRFTPAWVGGSPADGGGFDKQILRLIRAQKVGTKIALTWEMPEGKRVVAIEGAE